MCRLTYKVEKHRTAASVFENFPCMELGGPLFGQMGLSILVHVSYSTNFFNIQLMLKAKW